MFSGIVTHLGTVQEKSKDTLNITSTTDFTKVLQTGLSVAVNGICLTVIDHNGDSFSVDFMPETERVTNLADLKPGQLVNLELPATPETFLSGHIVQGHIDGIAEVVSINSEGNSQIIRLRVPKQLSKYIVAKGSVAINGISLTVIESNSDQFSVGIIPHTWDKTMLNTIKVGDKLNIEVDILAKYMENLLKK